MKITKKVTCLPLSVLLMSASSSNFIYASSKIKHGSTMCKKQIIGFSRKKITTLSNVKKLPVASLTFNYELYQMYKPTELITTYHPGYVLLYQADIYVNNRVQYKGGIGNWFDGCHSGFLNYIDINAVFDGLEYTGNSYQCPSYDSHYATRDFKYLRGVDPHDSKYSLSSADNDKQSFYNRVDVVLAPFEGGKFQDCSNLYTNSYYNSALEINDDFNLLKEMDSRLVALETPTINVSNNKTIEFDQLYQYNTKVEIIEKDGKYEEKFTSIDNGLYSGPCTNGKDDDKPFNFTFYGCFAVESNKLPDTIRINLKMDTYHGSTTYLDKFESMAQGDILLRLKS